MPPTQGSRSGDMGYITARKSQSYCRNPKYILCSLGLARWEAKMSATLKPDLALGELRLSLGGPMLCGSDLTCGDQEQNSRQNMNVDIVPPLLHGITLCMPA